MLSTSASSAVTQHQQDLPAPASSTAQHPPADVLTLRLVPRRKKKAVRWSSDVVDNEHMNKKSSKQCCIFHKKRAFGDFSDSDDEDLPNTCSDPEPNDDSSSPD